MTQCPVVSMPTFATSCQNASSSSTDDVAGRRPPPTSVATLCLPIFILSQPCCLQNLIPAKADLPQVPPTSQAISLGTSLH